MDRYKILKTLEQLAAINACNSMERWQADVLEILSKSVDADRAVFYSQAENMALKTIYRNIETKNIHAYMNHFYSKDPLMFVADHDYGLGIDQGPKYRKTIVSLEEVVERSTLERSEYYNEFLKPQRIANETIIYLPSGRSIMGVISLISHKEKDFSNKELNSLTYFIPYISSHLNNFILRQTIHTNDIAFKLLEEKSSEGIMIIDADMHVMYKNASAQTLIRGLQDRYVDDLFSLIIDICRTMQQDRGVSHAAFPTIPVQYSLDVGNRSLAVLIREIREHSNPYLNGTLFAVSIENATSSHFNRKRIQAHFSLTTREAEIVEGIFKGQSNAQIAKELFISEYTVKKHINNIMKKTGLKSRTAIIHIVLKAFNII